MSFGTHGASAIPDRLSVDYAPTGRAACKACGSNIAQDSVRVGEKVKSPWHDGFDIKYYHAKCGLGKGQCVHEFKVPARLSERPQCPTAPAPLPHTRTRYRLRTDSQGFQRLRWADQLEIAARYTPGIASAAPTDEMQRVKRLNEHVWEVKDKLAKVPKAALKELIQLNGVWVSDKATPAAMIHGVADGLVGGLLKPCPWCKGHSLEREGNLLRCYGYMEGSSTHCVYKSCDTPPAGCTELFGSAAAERRTEPALLERGGAWVLTEPLKRALKGWAPPSEAAVTPGSAGASTPAPAMAAGAVAEDELGSEDEEVADEFVMAGTLDWTCLDLP